MSRFVPNKKLLVVVIVSLIILAGVWVFFDSTSFKRNVSKALGGEVFVLYQSELTSVGCPFGPSPCDQTNTLYYSGKLVKKGITNSEEQLGDQVVTDVIEKIREEDMMNKNCNSFGIVFDANIIYTLNVDNKQKKIEPPSCTRELRELEDLIFPE